MEPRFNKPRRYIDWAGTALAIEPERTNGQRELFVFGYDRSFGGKMPKETAEKKVKKVARTAPDSADSSAAAE